MLRNLGNTQIEYSQRADIYSCFARWHRSTDELGQPFVLSYGFQGKRKSGYGGRRSLF